MTAAPIEVRTDDGWTLRGERRPCREARAIVLCGHAMMVDRRTLDRPSGLGLASVLLRRGLEPILFDARGHGESGPTASQGARFDYDDYVTRDVPAMVRFAREVADGRAVFVLGHSLIGHAALIAAGRGDAPDGIVALAPNLWTKHLEPSLSRRILKGALLDAWSAAATVRGYYDPRPMRMGSATLATPYIRQFRTMWRRDHLASPDGAIDYEAALSAASLPVLAYSSDNDRLFARPESVASFLALARNADVEHRVLRGHGAPDHMGFVLSPRAEPLWNEAADWMLARIA